MSESVPSPSSSSQFEHGKERQSGVLNVIRLALYLGLAATVGALGYSTYQAMVAKSISQKSHDSLVKQYGVTAQARRQLAPGYTDKDASLLADTPADPAKLLNPETLVVAYGEDSDLDVQPIAWNEFQSHLAQATGKKVEMQLYRNTGDDVASVRDGNFHIMALHAADAPYLVNNAGFIPVAVVGSDAGAEGNRLDVAVGPQSSFRKLADLKGQILTCSMPDSIVGYRAAVAVLLEEEGLHPDVDYVLNFSGGQTRSVLGVVSGEFDVVALSHDKLQILLKEGRLQESDLRTIYQSQVIPRFTIGYVYNLKPELAAKIQKAIMSFKNEGGPIDEDRGTRMRFVATDYKKDFEFVRKIDERFAPRLGPKESKAKGTADAADGAVQL